MSDQTAFDDLCHDACGDNADKRAAFIEGWRKCAEEIERQIIGNADLSVYSVRVLHSDIDKVKGQARK
jgi:hypothetical protein